MNIRIVNQKTDFQKDYLTNKWTEGDNRPIEFRNSTNISSSLKISDYSTVTPERRTVNNEVYSSLLMPLHGNNHYSGSKSRRKC
jgi:hypothetical protein